jgi:hypothetical protein
METLFIFLVKSSGLIGMFYLAYFLLLRKETFFNSNRWFLLAGLITSVVLPLVVFTKIVWVDPSPTTFDWSKIPMTTTTTTFETTTRTAIQNDTFEINWYLVFAIIYSIGILMFLMKFAFDFYSLSKVLKGKTIQHQADFKFIDVTENVSPFSYFNSIVYNSSLYNETELENILEHEKVHSTQNHTVDVLISRLFCVVFWFHPLVWLYKKAIVQNLEFIADSEASKNISDKKAYQLTLLKITTQENCVVLTNHFYQSLIKKRIVMLNKNQSNKRNSWKYAVVLPLLGAFLFFFQVKVVAQEKAAPKLETETKSDKVEIKVIKNENDSNTLSEDKEISVTSKKDKKDIEKTDVNTVENPLGIITRFEQPIKSYLKDYCIDGVKSTYNIYRSLDVNNIKVEANPYERQVIVTTIKADTRISTIDDEQDRDKNSIIEINTDNKNRTVQDDYDKFLVILDGKETDYKTLLKNADKELHFVHAIFFKNTPDESKRIVLAQWGEKVRNGVLVVESNTYYRKK